MKNKIASVVLVSAFATGCMTYDPYTGEEKVSNTTKGAAAGAVTGAIIGAIANDGKGAAVGALAGGLIGGGIGNYMDRQEAQLRHKLEGTGVRVVRNGDAITLVMPGNITFDTGRAEIKANFYDVLNSVVLVVQEFDQTAIEISGHTDSTGSAEFNQTLSEQRAGSVKTYLVQQGIPSGRVQAVGFGPRRPIASNDNAAGRQANRRVEMRLLPLSS